MSRQEFKELCRDRVFYVAAKCGLDQRALCRDTTFCVVTELVKTKSSMSRQSVSVSRQSWLDMEDLCRNKIFYVATECGQMERFCVAIEKFYVAT